MTKTVVLDRRMMIYLLMITGLVVAFGGVRTALAQDMSPAAAMDSMTLSAGSTQSEDRFIGEMESAVTVLTQTDVSFDDQGHVQIKLPQMSEAGALFDRPAVSVLENGSIRIDGVLYGPTDETVNASGLGMRVFESADEQIVLYNADRDILLTLDGGIDASGKRVV